MVKESSLDEYKKAYRENKERRGFFIHLAAYIIVNIMLVAINLIYTPLKSYGSFIH